MAFPNTNLYWCEDELNNEFMLWNPDLWLVSNEIHSYVSIYYKETWLNNDVRKIPTLAVGENYKNVELLQ